MLELKNVSFEVDDELGNKEIIKDISLTIPDNKMIVITGPNGGGKSTLARLIAGIEKPTSGKIFLDGEDITDMSITDRANKRAKVDLPPPFGPVITIILLSGIVRLMSLIISFSPSSSFTSNDTFFSSNISMPF